MRTLILFSVMISLGAAHAVSLEAAKGKTTFLAIGRPSALKIKGEGQGATGNLEFKVPGTFPGSQGVKTVMLTGEASVDLSTLNSGIGMRDSHMKEKYLETDKFKNAVLKFKDAAIAADILKKGGEISLPATLSLHGQEKPVTVSMTVKPGGEKIAASSKFKLKLSEFAIAIPSFSGITVADEVEVETETEVPASAVKDI